MKETVYIEKISADRYTPLVLFKKLKGIALLESAILEMGKSRYSIIMLEEAFRVILENNKIFYQKKIYTPYSTKYYIPHTAYF